jgi:hypothetical protein
MLWAVVAVVGAATVLSYAILADYFRRSLPNGPMAVAVAVRRHAEVDQQQET